MSVLVRYRRAAAAERAQLKWLVYAAGVIAAGLLAEMFAEKLLGPGDVSNNLQNAMTSGVVALVPLAIAVAVLRYRLYDIDRVISRTVAYTIVTGLLIGIYAGLVLLATGVLGLHSSVAVAAATLTAAARLKDAVDLDTVRADLTGVVHTTLEPAHISVWTSRPG